MGASLPMPPRGFQSDFHPASHALSDEDELWRMIAEAAYYRAEKRGFAPGFELDDWRAAEAQILAVEAEILSRMRF